MQARDQPRNPLGRGDDAAAMNPLMTTLLLTALPSLDRPCDATKGRTWQATYQPSFHLPLVVTLEELDGRVNLEVKLPAETDGGVEVRTSRVELEADEGARLVAALEREEPGHLGATTKRGLDGMRVRGKVCGGGRTHEFEAWSPRAEDAPRHARYFRALLEAARGAMPEERVRFAAESTLGYLLERGELLYADTATPVRTVRLISVSADEADAFRALLARLPKEGPLVVDLRNFDGAGTMFRADFVALEARPRTVIVASERMMKEHLSKYLGLKGRTRVDTLEAAYAKLR